MSAEKITPSVTSASVEPPVPPAAGPAVPPETEPSASPTADPTAPVPVVPEPTPTVVPAAGRRNPSAGAIVGIGIAGVLLGAVLMGGIAWAAYSGWDAINAAFGDRSVSTTTTAEPAAPLTTEAIDTVAVASKALPSVASISTQVQTTDGYFGMPTTGESSGSGVVITADGYIVTNFHVIAGGTSIKVVVAGETYDATVVGTDESSDLAVLKVKATGLTPISVGSSDQLKVGEFVMAVGSPFGLGQSVSTGIVSGLGRSTFMENQTTVSAYIDLIQTDAAINPGNSGGALVNSAGQLVGINTLIESTSGSSAGVGFAIPVETAMDIANQLMTDGTASHAFLGVSTQSIDSQMAQMYSLSVEEGAYVTYVTANSPAAQAGIAVGDIITSIGGQKVTGMGDVFTEVRSHAVGDRVSIGLDRDGKSVTVTVTLGDDASFTSAPRQ